jgi:ppGpp synthetase/RelA/SpoT-type nucleotidyltranferase
MQDIGGCRAVLDTQEQVQRVADRFRRNSHRRNHQSDKTKDYVDSPKPSGYRAIHIYTRYHGRRIEVQLRTPGQDFWAKFVEAVTQISGIDFKNGAGRDEAHEGLRELADFISMGESGQLPTEALREEITSLAAYVLRMSGILVQPGIREEA